jgi:hypothetical protein
MKFAFAAAAFAAIALTPAASAQSVFDQPAACQATTDVYAVVGGQRQVIRAIVVTTRTHARPFAGVRQYAVMPGGAAQMRVAPNTSFIVAAPSNVQPQGMITLAHFESRGNVREVLVGGGYMSYSTGIHPDRIIGVTMTQAASQAGAPAGTTLYTVTPSGNLAPGEYALVVMGQMQQGYAGIPGTFYDFGVDG